MFFASGIVHSDVPGAALIVLPEFLDNYIFSFSVAKDYVRLMKYGDSLYRCKQLKRAALGR